jgi:hypothetical protein
MRSAFSQGVQVERVDVASSEAGRDRVAAAAQSSYDARDDSSHNSDDGSTGSWEAPAVLKTATSYSARQSVSNQQDCFSSKPASDTDVVSERDSIADRDNSYVYHYNWSANGGGGVVAGRKSTVGGPDNFPDSSFSATPAPRFSMASQRPQQSMQNSAFEEKTKFSERTSRSFVSKSPKQVSQPKALAF